MTRHYGSLGGKTAIVSGVGPGLGIEIVRSLAREQAHLVLGDLDAESLARASEEALGLGTAHVARRTDIRNSEDCEELVGLAMETFGRVDILINDAFLAEQPSTFEDASIGTWQAVADVNLWGTLRMIKAALPGLKRSGDGCIVNINTRSSPR